MATYLEYLPSNPIVVEGYAPAPTVADRFRLSRARAALVRGYVLSKYDVPRRTPVSSASGGGAWQSRA
jgi:outer membrane protein OmpA-like peptidoglycan-associated protein